MLRRAVLGILGLSALLLLIHCAGGGPEKTFEKFASAWADERVDEAVSYCEGEAAKNAVKAIGISQVMSPYSIQTLGKIDYAVQSSEKGVDSNQVILTVEQTVYFNPPGVESAMRAAMYMTIIHKVTMQKASGSWKVASFSPKVTKISETK